MDFLNKFMRAPLVSVVIATYNSSKTLDKVLLSLKKQTFSAKRLEILIVDGGSTDGTVEIARKYQSVRLIRNPKTEPVYAKFLGYHKAKGRYLMFLDHDEVLLGPRSIEKKISALKEQDKVKVVVGSNYRNPRSYPFVNQYINEFGDPFSFFVYRISKDERFFLNSLRKRYRMVRETPDYVTFDTGMIRTLKAPLVELVAGATMIDKEYFQKRFPRTLKDPYLLPHLFYFLIKDKKLVSVTKNDAVLHYSSDDLLKYLKKINWRIKNNIYRKNSLGYAGFMGRERFQKDQNKYKKYLFLPYGFLLIPSLVDSLALSLTRRSFRYTLHSVLSFYVSIMIIYHYLLYKLGVRLPLKSYDDSLVVSG